MSLSHRIIPSLTLLGALGLLAVQACAVGSPVGSQCKTGSDCESGACNDGVCIAAEGGGSTGGGAEGGAGSTGGNGMGGDAAGGSGEGGNSGLCSPGHDGIVTRDEVPLAAGLDAKLRIATDITLSTAGEDVGGVTTWDMSGALDGDHTVLIETLPIEGAWYADDFAGATYAAKLTDDSDLLGVFELTDDAVLLRGVVSPDSGLYETNLAYDPPVVVLQFPLQEGATWTTDSTVSGTAQGVFSVYYETYDSQVDGRGDAITPFATFDVLRVRVDLTRTVGVLITTQTTFAFVAECFGTIAKMTSQIDETSAEFSDISEIQRLTP